MEERCPPADYDRILARLRKLYYGAWGLFLIGGTILLGVLAMGTWKGVPGFGPGGGFPALDAAVGLLLHAAGLALYARSKGLPWAWGLLGLGCVFGWAVLAALPKRCRYCDRSPAGRGLDCRFCGGPI